MLRKVFSELLDSDSGTAKEILDSLHDLDTVNRRFGGVSSYITLVRRIARECVCSRLSLLDVAAGSGYVPLTAAQRLREDSIELSVSLLDRSRCHMPKNSVPILVGDALSLPVADRSYDVVASSLFLHHLEPDEVAAFAREALRVARRGVIVSDIVRSRVHLGLTYAARPLFRSRLSRHDGPVSVRRAYTPGEVESMLRDCGARRIEIESGYLYRMNVLLWK